MRHLQAVVLVLTFALVGCCGLLETSREVAPTIAERQPMGSTTPGQTFVLDVALLERPRGDAFLNQDLWELGNEQGVNLETKPILEEHGLRVGQIGGLLPPRLQALMTSKRTCPDPRRLRAESEQPAPVQVGPSQARLAVLVGPGDPPRKLELTDAVCFFEVIPQAERQDGIRLTIRPVIRHGQAKIEPRVERDAEGTLRWSVEARDYVEEFPDLHWEMNLNADEYVLIGARLDRTDRLGPAMFLSADGRTQRLLVLRALRLEHQVIDENLSQSPPLALQATWTARGSRP
ncbi:MAG: hypothetical protein U0840_06570 [Gemmataceae bacterium]